jgi:hypothetical protein
MADNPSAKTSKSSAVATRKLVFLPGLSVTSPAVPALNRCLPGRLSDLFLVIDRELRPWVEAWARLKD